jgi:antitoxin (DNA-binding transcriptional repressor) of toxin-antitoxin stability system
MPSYGVLEAKNRFSELIERAEKGEEVIITRHGKPVVRFGKPDDSAEARRERAREAIEWVRANRPKNSGITQEEIRAWINEGRR